MAKEIIVSLLSSGHTEEIVTAKFVMKNIRTECIMAEEIVMEEILKEKLVADKILAGQCLYRRSL